MLPSLMFSFTGSIFMLFLSFMLKEIYVLVKDALDYYEERVKVGLFLLHMFEVLLQVEGHSSWPLSFLLEVNLLAPLVS